MKCGNKSIDKNSHRKCHVKYIYIQTERKETRRENKHDKKKKKEKKRREVNETNEKKTSQEKKHPRVKT
jgi:hypothetical protein